MHHTLMILLKRVHLPCTVDPNTTVPSVLLEAAAHLPNGPTIDLSLVARRINCAYRPGAPCTAPRRSRNRFYLGLFIPHRTEVTLE